MKYTHIIWDWNGTLLDDVDASVSSMNDLFSAWQMPLTNREEYRALMEQPVRLYYEKLFDLNVVSFEKTLSPIYHEGYNRHADLIHLAAGAQEALAAFRDAGCVQAVVSAWEHEALLQSLRAWEIDEFFALVSGAGGGDRFSGPKEARAAAALKTLGAAPERTVFLGDSPHDFSAAHAAGADCILIAAGHESRAALEKCGVPVADDLSEAVRMLLGKDAQ